MNKIFSGKILYGKQLGRTIGFPTANIHVEAGKLLPCTYGVSVDIEWKKFFWIGAYIPWTQMLEVHIFDFESDIYDTEITIEILLTIRDNKKFNSLEDLKNQIHKDKQTMEKWIQKNKRP